MPILKCPHGDVEIVDTNIGLADFIFHKIDSSLDKVALSDDATGEEITFGSLRDQIRALAGVLHQRGFRKGDVICLFADKSITATIALFAILKIGAIMTPCRPSEKSKELSTQMNKSNSKGIIADKNLLDVTQQALKDSPQVKLVLSVTRADGYDSVQDLVSSSDVEPLPEIPINPKKDVALIVFSSGTTGLPKGVLITHYSEIALTYLMSLSVYKETDQDAYFQSAPPFHVGGLHNLVFYLHNGKRLVLITHPPLTEYLLKAKQHQMRMVPMMPNELLELTKYPPEKLDELGVDFSQVIFGTGGSVFNATNTREVLAKTRAKAVIQGYGSTEAGMVSMDDRDNFVPGSVGNVAPNTLLKIVDLNTGETLGPNQPGEVCVKGPCVTPGYFNNPEATKEAFDDDGFFRLGDVGYYDDTEHLFIIDRIKDVIKYKTMQVSPAEIEEVIYTLPAVKAACVVPVEDDAAGEVPLACVILKEGQTATEQEIVQLVEENLADYKHLRGGVKFMDEFPLTAIGKILRRELRDQIRAERKTN